MAEPISKQERIRLNQQRSRARKQEYMQDLERRVRDCQGLCREADLLKGSYHQLQRENVKLRALLGSLGIGDIQVDSYVNSDAPEPSTEQTPLRHLRPKLPSDIVPAHAPVLASLDDVTDSPLPSMPQSLTSTVVSSTSSSCCNSACPSAGPEVANTSVASSSTLDMQQPQYCDTFLTYFEPILRPTPDNSILCSQAQDLIDQYNIGGQDMQYIGFRLATGFAPEINPGEGCRVNKRLLFEILNEISSEGYSRMS